MRAQDRREWKACLAIGSNTGNGAGRIAPVIEQLRPIHADTGIGELARTVAAQLPAFVQREIAVGRLHQWIDHHQVRKAL